MKRNGAMVKKGRIMVSREQGIPIECRFGGERGLELPFKTERGECAAPEIHASGTGSKKGNSYSVCAKPVEACRDNFRKSVVGR